MPEEKLSPADFALKIKAKYPQYKDMDDSELVERITSKYPEYLTQISVPEKKKSTQSQSSVSAPAGGGQTSKIGSSPSRIPSGTNPFVNPGQSPAAPTVLTQQPEALPTQPAAARTPISVDDQTLNTFIQGGESPLAPTVLSEERQQEFIRPINEKTERLRNYLGVFNKSQGKDTTKEVLTKSNDVDNGEIKTPGERSGNRAGYVYNELLGGVGSIANAVNEALLVLVPMSEEITGMSVDDYRYNEAPKTRSALVDLIGSDVDKGKQAQYSEEFLTSAIGGLANSAPAMLSGGLRTAAFALQGMDMASRSITEADVDRKISPEVKTIYAMTVGAATSALEKIGFDRIFKGSTNGIATAIANDAIKEAADAGEKVTGDYLQKYLQKRIKGLSDKFSKGGMKVLNATVTEGATGSAQEIVNIIGENTVNAAKGESIFDTEDLSKWEGFVDSIKRIGYAGAQEAVGGGIMGAVASVVNRPGKQKVSELGERVTQLTEQLDNPDLPDSVREVVLKEKIKTDQEIQSEIEADIDIQDRITPEQHTRLEEIERTLDDLSTAIDDPSTPESVISALTSEIESLDAEYDQIVETAKKQPVQESEIVPDAEVVPAAEQAIPAEIVSTEETSIPVAEEIIPSAEQVVPNDPQIIANEEVTEAIPEVIQQVPEPIVAEEELLPEPGQSEAQEINSTEAIEDDTAGLTEAELQYKEDTPEQLATKYAEEVSNPTILSEKERAISEMPFSIKRESYKQFGDPNNITPSKAKSYFSKEGKSADVVAQEINNSKFDGNEVVTPEDVIAFMDRFPNGTDSVKTPSSNPTLKAINDAYFEKTGKKLNRKTAKEIAKAHSVAEETVTKIVSDDKVMEEVAALFDKDDDGNYDWDDIGRILDEQEDFFTVFPGGLTNDEVGALKEIVANEKNKKGTSNRGPEVSDGGQVPEPEEGRSGSPEAKKGGRKSGPSFQERLSIAETAVKDATNEVSVLESEYNKLTKARDKNFKENQAGIFENKTQSMFDDRANQESIILNKKTELDNAKARLRAAKEELQRVSDSENQEELFPVDENYDTDVFAGTPNNQTGRTAVMPLAAPPKKVRDIINDLAKGLKQALFFLNPGRRALGTYSPSSSAVKIKFNGDLDTTAHEIGHAIDDKYKILVEISADPNAVNQLKPYSKYGSKPPKGHPNPQQYRLAEGFAEWVRAYVVNPDQAKKDAPGVFQAYEKMVPESDRKHIDQFSTDIRTLAGASAHDLIMANVEVKPKDKQNILQRLFSKEETNSEFNVSWADKFAVNWTNPLQVFNKAFEYAKGIKGVDEVLPQNNPEILSRLLLGIDGKFGAMLEEGITDAEGNVMLDANGKPMNISWLLAPFDNSDVASIEKDMEATISYMVAQRTIELGKRFGRDKGLSGIGAGIKSDIEAAEARLKELEDGDPETFARIEEAAKRYRDFSDTILRYMVDKGRISEESYQEIKDNNEQYVAMQRVYEISADQELESSFGGKGSLGSTSEVIKKIKGSSKTIINPYIPLLDTLYKGIKESDRNEVMVAFRDMLVDRRAMYDGDPQRLSDIGVQAKQGDKNTTTIFVDGKPEYWVFQKDVYSAIKSLDSDGYKLPLLVRLPGLVLRNLTTNFPIFAARNWARDLQDRLIKSNDNEGLSGIKNLFGDKQHWKDLAMRGGLNAGYYYRDRTHYYGLLREAMTDMAKDKKFILMDPEAFKRIGNKYQDILSLSEGSNRVAEYRTALAAAKKQGMDDYNASLYAAYRSRDLIDFAVAGHYMRIANQLIPFSNAAVQGLRSTYATATTDPKAFATRVALYSVIPQIAMWFWNHRDEEEAEEYENMPGYQRDMYWMFKVGDNKWAAIPKPFELSLPAAGIDRFLSKMVGKNKDAFKGYAGAVANSFMPFDESNLAGPFQTYVEGISNYDFFREKHIVPPAENALNMALRHTKSASVLGQKLQELSGFVDDGSNAAFGTDKGIFTTDARKIDHFVQGQFSYFGKLAMDVSNIGSDNNKFGFDETDTGFIKNSPAYNAPAVQKFMKYATEFGLTRRREYKRFSDRVGDYFEEKDAAVKEQKAKDLIDYAKKTHEIFKELDIADKKIKKFERKNADPD